MIVKVCGMSDAVNIRLAEQLNIDWMGFIFYPPSPRYVERRPDYLPRRQRRVGVFVNADEAFILSRISLFGLQLLQLHGHETPQQCRALREISGLPLIKAFSVRSAADVALPRHYEGIASAKIGLVSQDREAGGAGMGIGGYNVFGTCLAVNPSLRWRLALELGNDARRALPKRFGQ